MNVHLSRKCSTVIPVVTVVGQLIDLLIASLFVCVSLHLDRFEHDHEDSVRGPEATWNPRGRPSPGLGSDRDGWTQRTDKYHDECRWTAQHHKWLE